MMGELEDDFRSTAEDIAHDARRLGAIEDEKSRLDPADPHAATLTANAEELAEDLHRKALAERDLTDAATEPS
jgi:hypothetical protein